MSDFHEAFWSVTATLGPGLAVVIVVVINRHDVLSRLRTIRGRAKEAKDDPGKALSAIEISTRTWSHRLQVSAWIGFGLATLATILALLSLAASPPEDICTPYLAVGLLIGSGAMLPITTLVDSKFKSLDEVSKGSASDG